MELNIGWDRNQNFRANMIVQLMKVLNHGKKW